MENRARKGSSFIELAAALIVVIPLVLYGIDAATIYFGQSINSDYCREACRAAANGPPFKYSQGTDYTPKKRAVQVMKNRDKPGSIIRVSVNPAVNEELFDPVPTKPFGGPVNGVVSVRSFVRIYPPLVLPGFPHIVDLKTQTTFPYTYVLPSSFQSASGGIGGGTTTGSTGGFTGGSIDGKLGDDATAGSSGGTIDGEVDHGDF